MIEKPYEPWQKQQVKDALLKYQIEKRIKGSSYYTFICDEIGKEAGSILNEGDPKNWFSGSEPEEDRFEAFLKFILKVYPDFKFLKFGHEEYIKIGMTFARFSIGQAKACGPKFVKQAKILDSKIYVSEPDKNGPDGICEFISFSTVAGSAFLIVKKFRIVGKPEENKQTKELIKLLLARNDGAISARMEITKKIALYLDKNLNELLDKGVLSIESIEKGIISPSSSLSYLGILKSNDYKATPMEVSLLHSQKTKKITGLFYSAIIQPTMQPYVVCDRLKSLKRMISQMKGPFYD